MARKWGRDREFFDFSSNTPRQRGVVAYALEHCDFPWKVLKPGLGKAAGKDRISIHWKWLTQKQWDEVSEGGRQVHPISARGHSHGATDADEGHGDNHEHDHSRAPRKAARAQAGPAARRAMDYGWAVDDGRMFLQSRKVSERDLMASVFLLEGAHFVDYHYLTDEHRDEIYEIFHRGSEREHEHGWWETEGAPHYEQMVGESFMFGFVYAFSDLKPDESAFPDFRHDATPAIGRKIRELLLP
ncbi:MAG: hypothetical protein ABR505_08300 [Actinomycetota bacterium]